MPEIPVSRHQPRQRLHPAREAGSARIGMRPLKGHRPPLYFWVGLFFLILLVASVIFDALHPELRVTYLIGLAAGLGAVILKTSNQLRPSLPGDRINITPIQVLMVIPLLFMLVIVYFAGGNVCIWLAGNQPLNRFLTLGLGILCGVGIEVCLDRTLSALKAGNKA